MQYKLLFYKAVGKNKSLSIVESKNLLMGRSHLSWIPISMTSSSVEAGRKIVQVSNFKST